MKQYELIAPCHFGMEAVLKREIQNLGYEISQVDNGKVTFFGDAAAIARANIFLRTTERILLKIDSFRATSFDDLFEAVKAIPWADYIPEDGKFWVTKANSVSSKLFSPSDIQKIVKKAMVEKLKHHRGLCHLRRIRRLHPGRRPGGQGVVRQIDARDRGRCR